MKQVLAATVRALVMRVGWHGVGIALSLAIIAVAIATLFHILRDVDLDKVWVALEATPARAIVVAALLIVAAYLTLTCYDFFALRTVGRAHVPYRIAALAAFTSYAIGHNIGATVFTGGAIRYRIYSAWGLTVVDVAKMAFVTGLTFWLGNLFVLGSCLAVRPSAASAINMLPAEMNRAIGLAMLALIAMYVAWIARRPRRLGRASWRVVLPGPRLTMVQIAIGVADLGFSGLALYMLLPASAQADLIAIIVTFVTSTLLAFASHAPGGLGVFDAAMLVALARFEKEPVIAALLLFRLLYYIVPFALALALLGARELWVSLPSHQQTETCTTPLPCPSPARGEGTIEPPRSDAGARLQCSGWQRCLIGFCDV